MITQDLSHEPIRYMSCPDKFHVRLANWHGVRYEMIFSKILHNLEFSSLEKGKTIGEQHSLFALDYNAKLETFHGITHEDRPLGDFDVTIEQVLAGLEAGNPMFFALKAKFMPDAAQILLDIDSEFPVLVLAYEEDRFWYGDYYDPHRVLSLPYDNFVEGVRYGSRGRNQYVVYPKVEDFEAPPARVWAETLLQDLPGVRKRETLRAFLDYLGDGYDLRAEEEHTEYGGILADKLFQNLFRSYRIYPLAVQTAAGRQEHPPELDGLLSLIKQLEDLSYINQMLVHKARAAGEYGRAVRELRENFARLGELDGALEELVKKTFAPYVS